MTIIFLLTGQNPMLTKSSGRKFTNKKAGGNIILEYCIYKVKSRYESSNVLILHDKA